jgi:hypothetical protein
MRKAILMAGLLVACTASIVSAQSVDLNWNQCESGSTDTNLRTLACTANTGTQAMIASFYAPPSVTNLENIEVIIDFQVPNGGVMPCWWNLSSGATRAGALTVLGVDPLDANGDPLFLCPGNYFGEIDRAVAGGMVVVPGTDRGKFAAAIARGVGQGGNPGTGEQYACGFRISNILTTTCAGCNLPGVFVLNRVTLGQGGGAPPIELNSPQNNNCTSWQNTGIPCNVTPTRNSTWGSVKALYR